MKAVVAAMLLLLALVHHAGGHHQGHIWKHDHGGHRRSSSPLAGLPQCVKKEKKRKQKQSKFVG